MADEFSVTCILHVIYGNEYSCLKMGHDRTKYVNVTVKDPKIMQDKEVFVGMMIRGLEELYDRLPVRRD